MTRLGMVEDDDYLPEFGTLMIRDGGQPAERSAGAALLDEYATDAQPCGTVARAGNGWLEGAAGDGHHTVRLEYHDRAVDEDHHDWDDVVETPYLSATGAVGLTYVTGGPAGPDLALGRPGCYRVRVTRRSGEDGDHWLLRFWPDSEPLAPPRWFARREPAVWPADPGWRGLLGGETDTMVSIIGQADADGATIEHLDDWGRRHSWPAGWLDQELLPEPPEPLPTGHPDLDDGARRQHRDQTAEVARQRAALDGIAAQLGVPAPRTRRHLLAALVAAGVIVLDERGRYRVVADPPRAQDVLDLPADRVAALNRQQARRFVSLASDIISIAAWTGSPAEATVDGLADRLLTTRENVRGALEFAVAEQLLDMAGELSLTVRPRRPRRSVVAIPQRAPVTTGADEVPAGAPPRAGVIAGDGAVLVWVDGAAVVRTRLPEQRPDRALESAHGLVLLGFSAQSSLVRPDGSVQPLGADLAPGGVLDRGGHRLAVVEEHYGRRSRHHLHLIDLADGSRQTMPWDESEDLALLGMHDGVAYFQRRYPPLTMRWEPGGAPEPLGYEILQLDSVSGTALAADRDGLVVIRPDGTRHRMALDTAARLAPGGTKLHSHRYSPPAVTVFDIPDGTANPQLHWLPKSCVTSTTTPWGRPVWEDTEHVVIPVGGRWALTHRARALRLDIRTGHLETVPVSPATGERTLFIEPLLT